MKYRLQNAIYDCLVLLGADSELLSTINSCGDTLTEAEVVAYLEDWVVEQKEIVENR